jgi:glycosyl transferase family 25
MINQIKVIVISLKNDHFRRKHIIHELTKLNLKFNFFFAKKGSELNRKERSLYCAKKAFENENRYLSLDEISCSISHFKIYKNILKYNYKYTLVLEDDVIINKNFLNLLNNLNKFPKNWELVNFYSGAKQRILRNPLYKNYYITQFLEMPNKTCAYLLKKKAAKTLIKYALPIRYPADGLTGRLSMKNIKSYGIKPNIIKEAKFPTTIKNRNTLIDKLRIKFYSWFKNITARIL